MIKVYQRMVTNLQKRTLQMLKVLVYLVQNPLHLVKILLNLALTLLNLIILQIMTLNIKQLVNRALKIQMYKKIMVEIQRVVVKSTKKYLMSYKTNIVQKWRQY